MTRSRLLVKIGGSVLEPEPAPALLAALGRLGERAELVLVHGGGKALNQTLAELGIESRFRNGLRITDERTLAAAVMTFAGTVNKNLVVALHAAAPALRAVGLTGVDGPCVRARIHAAALGHVGQVTACDATPLRALLQAGCTPVLAPLAAGEDGGVLNVNADLFAAALAVALAAERLIFVTDVAGVLDADGRRLPEVTLDALAAQTAAGTIGGGMLPKLEACREALEGGVDAVEIVGADAAMHIDVWAGRECPGTRVAAAVRQEV